MSFACIEDDPDGVRDRGTDAGLVLTGGAGADAGPSDVPTGAGRGGELPLCSASLSDAGAATVTRYELGLDTRDPLTIDGLVSSVGPTRIEVAASGATYALDWLGPGLDGAFAVGDAVQLHSEPNIGTSWGALRLSVLRSSSATAVVLDGAPWRVMSVEPGATATLQAPPELPELVYGLKSCCALGSSSHVGPDFQCDYSALEAQLDDDTTAIPLGTTGVIGPWSVTNVRSTYVTFYEHFWEIQVTLLGPATSRTVDGGL